MSRLIVKNLPNKVTVDSLKELFGQKGEVTDVQLKYTKDGKFRNFGFVGFRSEEQAAAAREHFDGTCIRSMKIQVEMCANLGDEKKPRAWSKYASDSTAYKKLHKDDKVNENIEKKKTKKKEKNKVKILELLKKHKEDPLFTEFMEAHVTDKNTWIKEALDDAAKSDDNDSGLEEEAANINEEKAAKEPANNEVKITQNDVEKVANKQISDLEYMKLLMKKIEGTNTEVAEKVEDAKPKKVRNRPLFHVKITGLPFKCKKKDIKEFFKPLVPYSIRLPLGKGKKLAGFCYVGFREEKELKKALNKDKLFLGNHRVHVNKYEDKAKKAEEEEEHENKRKKQEVLECFPKVSTTTFCKFVFTYGHERKFGTHFEKNMLEVVNVIRVVKSFVTFRKLNLIVVECQIDFGPKNQGNEESIGESGSIFVRNLPYIVSEEELTSLFEKYGPLAEVNLPIDPVLRQSKGFATVTFVMPEHAVKAYSELDGTAFCGRMLHLLPAKSEKVEESDDDGLTFKEKKAKKLKAQAKSSHNWNTLFLGANAIADVVASNYNTTKEQVLSDENKTTSAAVRLALGETQLVAETRSFLENNGVYLDAFTVAAKKRSKTCILAKNLPANTEPEELKALFTKFGLIARFLMPKHGISALIDFVEPFEAKKAFTKLAYSQFKSSPLYLEWAPENIFSKTADTKELERKQANDVKHQDLELKETNINLKSKTSTDKELENKGEHQAKDESSETEDPENDSTLFVKNLNFKTTEDMLKQHFSSCGKLHSATIAKKKDPKNSGQFLSMGYGFVQFYKKAHANEALKQLQSSTLDGKTLELKRSERGNTSDVKTNKKDSNKNVSQNGTKILVRNVPFQANRNELQEIFRAFGEIKTLRLPKKLSPGSDQHRGFAFVDYYTKADAKTAFEALRLSTHLYGRRLVLEWADQTDENEDISALRKRTAESFNAKSVGGKKSRKAAVDVEAFVEGE